MTRTNYDERRDLERVILQDITMWGDDLGINDCILRCIEDADRLEEMEAPCIHGRGPGQMCPHCMVVKP